MDLPGISRSPGFKIIIVGTNQEVHRMFFRGLVRPGQHARVAISASADEGDVPVYSDHGQVDQQTGTLTEPTPPVAGRLTELSTEPPEENLRGMPPRDSVLDVEEPSILTEDPEERLRGMPQCVMLSVGERELAWAAAGVFAEIIFPLLASEDEETRRDAETRGAEKERRTVQRKQRKQGKIHDKAMRNNTQKSKVRVRSKRDMYGPRWK